MRLKSAGSGADSETDVGKSFSPDLGAHGGGARPAAVADPSSASGAHADAGEEPAAAHCLEPGLAEETPAMERGRAGVVAESEAGCVDPGTTRYVVADAGGIGKEDPAPGPGSSEGSPSAGGSAAVGNPSRSGAGDFSGHGADHGRGTAVCRLA